MIFTLGSWREWTEKEISKAEMSPRSVGATLLLLLCAVAHSAEVTYSSAIGTRQRHRQQHAQQHLQPLLHFRGGSADSVASKKASSSLSVAARKLCTKPGLIAATGTSGSSFTLANHVRGIVFGGLDGILTTFALLAAVAGSGQTSTTLTLVIGISTVLADALSMGAGEYLSAKAEHELSGAGTAYPEDEPGPLEKAVAMFIAFTIFGSLPLVGCVISTMITKQTGLPVESFGLSVAITGLTLFALGGIKSQFGEGVWWQAGFEVTGIGAAATVAYVTARLIEKLMGETS